MVQTLISHEVEDFDQWHVGFKIGEANRTKHGIRIKGVYRGHVNPNHVTILSEADSKEHYDNMMADAEFAQLMQDYGVKSRPEMHMMNEVNE